MRRIERHKETPSLPAQRTGIDDVFRPDDFSEPLGEPFERQRAKTNGGLHFDRTHPKGSARPRIGPKKEKIDFDSFLSRLLSALRKSEEPLALRGQSLRHGVFEEHAVQKRELPEEHPADELRLRDQSRANRERRKEPRVDEAALPRRRIPVGAKALLRDRGQGREKKPQVLETGKGVGAVSPTGGLSEGREREAFFGLGELRGN